jgi:hypothetical protein
MGEPRHPGPRPPAFSFPFAEATGAREAIVSAAARLQATIRLHELAFAPAVEGFEGRSRHEFERGLEAVLDACRQHVSALLAQAGQLDDEVDVARRRRDAAIEAQQRWQRDLDRWQEARSQASAR